MPKMFLPNSLVKFYWYQVPYRYILSKKSNLDKYKGRINQYHFYPVVDDPGEPSNDPSLADLYQFPAGSLQYLNYSYVPYNPPVPQESPFLRQTANNTSKLVDIEFTFLQTDRGLLKGASLGTPPLQNFIAAGHNLLPCFLTFGFSYATIRRQNGSTALTFADYGTIDGQPNWFSFPFEMLFSDPDVDPNDIE